MRLEGILANSLGGFTCVRGYASLKNLSRISTAENYQRDLVNEQKDAIVNFLKDKEYLFFPEVILAYTLKYDYSKGISGIDPLTDIQNRKKFKSNVDKFTIISQKSGIHKVAINIPEKFLKHNIPFSRIDGNHRLSAAPKSEAFNDYITPFCLILFPDTKTSEEYKRVIFHNINSKSVPLTSEENLSLILDYDDYFTDEKLKTNPSFGLTYLFARKLYRKLDLNILKPIEEALSYYKENGDRIPNIRTVLINLFELLIKNKVIEKDLGEIERVHVALMSVNTTFKEFELLQESNSLALLIAFVYYELRADLKNNIDLQGDYRASFRNWVLVNHIYEIDEISASDLIHVYDRIITARSRHVFLSMQFDDNSKSVNDAVEEAINTVNQKYALDLQIKRIRIDHVNKGHSYTISDEILDLINSTGLLIADLSSMNINVYHEVGFLMGLNKAKGFDQSNFILLMRTSKEESTSTNVGFALRDWQQLRFSNELDLKNAVIKSLEIYYRLGAFASTI